MTTSNWPLIDRPSFYEKLDNSKCIATYNGVTFETGIVSFSYENTPSLALLYISRIEVKTSFPFMNLMSVKFFFQDTLFCMAIYGREYSS